MPTLNWIGKEKVINHHLEVPIRVLEHCFGVNKDGKIKIETGSGNKIIYGDNLEALKALLPEFEGKIKCIYIDPPYNTGNEGWIYNDNVNDPKIKKWLHQVVGKEDLSRHDKWLCMMYPRLQLLYKLLAEDGVCLVSIGDDEFYHLGMILKEIFGENNHIGTFCWKSRAKPANVGEAKFKPQKVSEYIIGYSKKLDKVKYNPIYKGGKRSYPNKTECGRKYRLTTILKSNRGESKRETMRFEIAGFVPEQGQRWQGGYNLIKGLYDNGYLEFNDGYPSRRYYEDEEPQEHQPFYTFMNPDSTGTAESGKTLLNDILGENHGFDTVKPVKLLEQILAAITNGNDIILDSFAGSGTTAHAVLNLNKRDGDNRKFILVEMEEYAEKITAERVKRVIHGYGDVEGSGGEFDYFTLGEQVFTEEGEINPSLSIEDIRRYIWYTETTESFIKPADECHETFLGIKNNIAYFFNYSNEHETVLNRAFLKNLKVKADSFIIYADKCVLPDETLKLSNIIFKKIPRDITKY